MKKILSFLIVLTVLVNSIDLGFLRVKASAEILTSTMLTLIESALANAAAGTSAYIANNNINSSGSSNLGFDLNGFTSYHGSNKTVSTISVDNVSGLTDGLLVLTVDGSTAVFSVDPSAPADQVEFANLLAYKLNSLSSQYKTVSDDGTITAGQFEAIKNAATNATLNYLNSKEVFGAGDAFANAGADPYDINLTGPRDVLSQGIIMPTSTGFVTSNISGFTLHPLGSAPQYGYSSRDQAQSIGCAMVNQRRAEDGNYYWVGALQLSNYGCGMYIVYNGQIYYNVTNAHSINQNGTFVSIGDCFVESSLRNFVNSSGESLASAGCVSSYGLQYGYFECTDPTVTTNIPANVREEDLQETSGGGELIIAPPAGSSIINSAIGAGILTPDSKLQVDENGNIIGADGLSLAQIEGLLNKIAEKETDFSSITGYLAAIQAATEGTNMSADQIAKIINNVKTAVDQNTTSISSINTTIAGVKELEEAQKAELEAINENTKVIADAITATQEITAEKKLDINTPSTITDKFPFSLPFDVYNTFNLLSAEPVAPKFTIPLKMEGVFEYEIEVDLSEYDWLANIVRWFIFVAFVVGLILITNKLIGRG